jgi:hypothetical protein
MPTMRVYQNGVEIESKEFHFQLRICRATYERHRLFWEADYEEAEPGGEIAIWIRRFERKSAGERFDIGAILPTWRLTIDGVPQEQQLYSELEVTGKEIELQYGDYRFVCSFPPFKDN